MRRRVDVFVLVRSDFVDRFHDEAHVTVHQAERTKTNALTLVSLLE